VTAARREIRFAQSAQDDLDDIVAWYESQLAPDAGVRLVSSIIERVEQLGSFPESGKVVPEFDEPHLRELQLSPFRILYRTDDSNVVNVVRVWRSERLMGPVPGGNA